MSGGLRRFPRLRSCERAPDSRISGEQRPLHLDCGICLVVSRNWDRKIMLNMLEQIPPAKEWQRTQWDILRRDAVVTLRERRVCIRDTSLPEAPESTWRNSALRAGLKGVPWRFL